MRLGRLVAMGWIGFMGVMASAAPGRWDASAAALADQIAEILGPGQAHLTVRNVSSLSTDEIPAIRRLLEQDLKSHGVAVSDADSASAVRVTLSEDARERLWVAEVVEGSETRVTMVSMGLDKPTQSQPASGMILRKQTILTAHEPVLAALETPGGLVDLEPEQIVFYAQSPDGWKEQKRINIGQRHPLARDPRGMLLRSESGNGFEARLPGIECTGNHTPAQLQGDWEVQCHTSDDPWTVIEGVTAIAAAAVEDSPGQSATAGREAEGPTTNSGANSLKAFYNAARNYFTGVVTPGIGVDLPPFYSSGLLPRAAGGVALLVNGINGKVQMADDGALKPISGTRDWGSDLAALRSGCGEGTQIVASGSGEAISDSLRAYELPALEAVPASAPLAMNGTVTALWPATDSKSVFAVVRSMGNEYEVDRVTANCN